MSRLFARPAVLCVTLLLLSAIPILLSAVSLWQLSTGSLPDDSARYAAVPVRFLLHVLGGLTFCVLGPLQFAGVLKQRYGRLHRVTGRIFALAGIALGLSGVALLARFPESATWLLDGMRGIAGGALVAALVIAVVAARRRDFDRHRAWMIRAYAIGAGTVTVAPIMFPIYLITGQPLTGLGADAIVVGSWVLSIVIAELVIRRIRQRRPVR